MSRQEVIDHIGTIAKSGTREFFQTPDVRRAKDAQLIGQFGVGFYSSFIVADQVTLVTRRAGLTAEDGVRWESAGEGDYTIEATRKETRGTDVILHLRSGEDELLSGSALRDDPSQVLRSHHRSHSHEEGAVGSDRARRRWSPRRTNRSTRPRRCGRGRSRRSPKSSTTSSTSTSRTTSSRRWPTATAKVEGRQEYTQLLFIPQRAPYDLWDREHRHGIKLYVRRVFIMDDAEQLMPAYLRFVRGVIDSSDLPLNVSREILQQSRDVETIRAASVKRVLGLLDDLAEHHTDKYATFWKEFGRAFKEGAAEDAGNKDRIAKLLRFASTHRDSDEQTVSLSDYVGRMKDGQDAIYYITADGCAAAKNSPHLEVFRKIGVEVLLMYDRMDEWVVSALTEFEGKPLQSVDAGETSISASSVPRPRHRSRRQQESEYQGLLDADAGRPQGQGERGARDPPPHRFAGVPGERRARHEHEPGASAESVGPERADHQAHPRDQSAPSDRGASQGRIGRAAGSSNWSQILFDQATLAEGGQLDDPATFVKRLNELMLTLAGEHASRIWTPG